MYSNIYTTFVSTAERLRESKYNISDEELRPYFALPNVLQGLFGVRGVYIYMYSIASSSVLLLAQSSRTMTNAPCCRFKSCAQRPCR